MKRSQTGFRAYKIADMYSNSQGDAQARRYRRSGCLPAQQPPHARHGRGLQAGKHVYCEKPMAGAYVDALTMYQTAQETGNESSPSS